MAKPLRAGEASDRFRDIDIGLRQRHFLFTGWRRASLSCDTHLPKRTSPSWLGSSLGMVLEEPVRWMGWILRVPDRSLAGVGVFLRTFTRLRTLTACCSFNPIEKSGGAICRKDERRAKVHVMLVALTLACGLIDRMHYLHPQACLQSCSTLAYPLGLQHHRR